MKRSLAPGSRHFETTPFHAGLPGRRLSIALEGIAMNWCFNWLIVIAFRRGLIDREKFASLWKLVQNMNELGASD